MAPVSGGALPRAVLLDTCAVIWLANGDPMAERATAVIVHAGLAEGVFVSPVSAWEIGLLSRPKGERRAAVRFIPDPKTWFAQVVAGPGIRQAALTPEIAIDASFLPDEPQGDPGDRLLIATARHLGVPIVTRDRSILDYGRNGRVQVIPC
jgi:PIN domain nuclease of toxin-antitoxin system